MGSKNSSPPPPQQPGIMQGLANAMNNQHHMPHFEFPEGPSFEELQQQQEEARQEALRTRNYGTIDTLWSARNDAVNAAITEVDRRIAEESSRANLLGVDYNVTDDQRVERIELLFGELWTESNETQLSNLTTQYGNPLQDEETRRSIESGDTTYDFVYDVNRRAGGDAGGGTTPDGGVDTNPQGQEINSGASTVLTSSVLDDEDNQSTILAGAI